MVNINNLPIRTINAIIALQRYYKIKKKIIKKINNNIQSCYTNLTGISNRVYENYNKLYITFDENLIQMDKIEKVFKIFKNLPRYISFSILKDYYITDLWIKIYLLKLEIIDLAKTCGANCCHSILQICIHENWTTCVDNNFRSIFKAYNRHFVPTSCIVFNSKDIPPFGIKCIEEKKYPYTRELSRESGKLCDKIHGAELICKLLNKNIIILGYFKNDPINSYIEEKVFIKKYNALTEQIKNFHFSIDFIDKYLDQYPLRDFSIYNTDEIINQIKKEHKILEDIKNDNLSSVIKKFVTSNLYNQREMVKLLLTGDKDAIFLAHVIFDMLNADNNITKQSQITEYIYKSLHWNQQKIFKKEFNRINDERKKIMELDSENISYEHRIMSLKAPENVKQKAYEKLKEIKTSRDGSITSKAQKYLDGLLKIPFGIYKKEKIICFLSEFTEKINNFIEAKLSESFIKNKFIDEIFDCIKTQSEKTCNFTTENEIDNLLNSLIDIINNNKKNINKCYKFRLFKNEILLLFNEWNTYTIEKKNYISETRITLDKYVYSHNDAKIELERIIAQWINGKADGFVFGLVGPPGIGKTCLIKDGLSKCLKDENGNYRPFAFLPIGGTSNGSTLEGHNYTYVGSTWGRIVDILIETQCMNPIIFIDELDKISRTEHGKEIIGILTHLTDSTQNTDFSDKYFSGIKFDLSKALIIFSYNDSDVIDRILKDRIKSIELKALTKHDKIHISKNYLMPKIIDMIGYKIKDIIISDETLKYIIETYTYEAGVRKLKEKLIEIMRDINLNRIMDKNSITFPYTVTIEYIKELFCNKKKVHIKKISSKSHIGIVNGLYATNAGIGGITIIQAFKTLSNSKELSLEFTGSQGDVMKESIKCSKTVALNIIPDEIKNKIKEQWKNDEIFGIHVHCPDTGTPKDGPSAGGAITLAIISQLCGVAVKNDVAMTGEIDLNGNITAIGGLEAKLEGAMCAKVKIVLIPRENIDDYNKIKDRISIDVIIIDTIYDILKIALIDNNVVFK